jgi:hypothetical protein
MSYEYNAGNGRLEISNPYRLENIALFFCGGLASIVAVLLLLGARTGIASADAEALRGTIVGVVLLAVGLGFLGKAFSQLRYFFGRGRPHNLSNPDSSETRDDRGRAAWLPARQRLRRAICHRAPPIRRPNLPGGYCTSCGLALTSGARFCAGCGARI